MGASALEKGKQAARGVARGVGKLGAATVVARGVRRLRGDKRDERKSRLRKAGIAAAGAVGGIYLVRRLRGRDETIADTATRARDSAVGAAHEARKVMADDRPAANDQELADRVRTEIFRPDDVPKGSISVNAEMGVVYLRGQVEQPEKIAELVAKAQAVEGVRAVENMLHTPGQPAPMKQETEPETRRRVFSSRRG